MTTLLSDARPDAERVHFGVGVPAAILDQYHKRIVEQFFPQ